MYTVVVIFGAVCYAMVCVNLHYNINFIQFFVFPFVMSKLLDFGIMCFFFVLVTLELLDCGMFAVPRLILLSSTASPRLLCQKAAVCLLLCLLYSTSYQYFV